MLLGGALGETRDYVDSRGEKSFLGRDTAEGTPVARAHCPKKSVRGDGLYLAVKRFLSRSTLKSGSEGTQRFGSAWSRARTCRETNTSVRGREFPGNGSTTPPKRRRRVRHPRR